MGFVNLLKKNTDPSELRANIERLAVSVHSTWNPNHRHDEKWEKELDAQREAICASHRMHSFAPERDGNHVKWYSDGCDYFWALSEILEKATSHIFILDWWLSPELYLRRPPHLFPRYRLDRILKRKAEQGVRIFIVVYKEVTQTMTMSSAWTKHYLEDLHPNIQVYRHPDHLGGEVTLYWSHHEKLVVVDNAYACIGGLDICYGRWDTQSHPMSDVHLTDYKSTLFPGQDYNNARIEDFHNVKDYLSNNQSRTVIGRMPWHDVHVMLYGPSVLDVAAHFIGRWSFLKIFKYKSETRMPHLALPFSYDPDLESRSESNNNTESLLDPQFAYLQAHPHLSKMALEGERFRHPFHPEKRTEYLSPGGEGQGQAAPQQQQPGPGSCRVQVLRSSADWSMGILTEHSIQNAYVEMISQAEHCIYIENQFFITATQGEGAVKNQIGAALVERILRASKENKKFKIIVIIPTIPCFAGELDKAAGIRAILAYQFYSISRGENSIFGQLRTKGVDASEYISFYHLRGYDRILYPASVVHEIERRSGVTYHQSQVALSRVLNGDAEQDMGIDQKKGEPKGPLHTESVQLFDPGEVHQHVSRAVKEANTPDPVPGAQGLSRKKAQRSQTDGPTTFSGTQDTIPAVPMPKTVAEARAILDKFEAGAREVLTDPSVQDSVAKDMSVSQPQPSSEPWPDHSLSGEEVGAWVTEEIYIHSKLMIVDDRRVIIGSANLNDRSQCGDRDSEIAVLIEDGEMIDSLMDGQPYQASKFAFEFRRHLWLQHLGHLPPQCVNSETAQHFPHDHMRPVLADEGDGNATRAAEEEHAHLVQDPLSEDLERLWKDRAGTNTRVYEEVFHPVPSDRVATWKTYHNYFPSYPPVVTGHVADTHADPHWVREHLDQIQGSLVNFSHHFMNEEDLVTMDVEVNNLTLDIYL